MSPAKNLKLGRFLRKARQDKGLSLRDLAEASKVGYSYIARLEQGEFRSPEPQKLQRLARVLEVEIEDFYAMAGYLVPEGLPEFAPYLRAKYNLSDRKVSEMNRYFKQLQSGQPSGRKSPPKKRGRDA